MESRDEILKVLEEMYRRVSVYTRSDNNLTKTDKQFIEQHFPLVRRRPFTKTSCGQCYADAIIEMLVYLRKNELMAKSNYILKSGVVLQAASDPKVYTNANLTDAVAERYLRDNPKRIRLFASYPDDWDERIKPKERTRKKEIEDSEPEDIQIPE